MFEFINKYTTQLNDGVLIASAIIAVIYFKKYKNYNSKIFIYYMIYVALVDFFGSYPMYLIKIEALSNIKLFVDGTHFRRNYWWFTIFWNIGSAVFLSYYFQKTYKSEIFTKVVRYVCLLFVISSFVYIIYDLNAFFNSQLKFINIFGALVILICISLYFIELLNSERILVFYKSLNSVAGATLFLWWLIITPLLFYEVYFSLEDKSYLVLRGQVYLFSNLFMYTTFSIALIFCNPQYD